MCLFRVREKLFAENAPLFILKHCLTVIVLEVTTLLTLSVKKLPSLQKCSQYTKELHAFGGDQDTGFLWAILHVNCFELHKTMSFRLQWVFWPAGGIFLTMSQMKTMITKSQVRVYGWAMLSLVSTHCNVPLVPYNFEQAKMQVRLQDAKLWQR